MFLNDFKRMFMKGLTALIPTVVTIAVIVWVLSWVSQYIASPINNAIISILPYPDDVPGFFRYFKVDSLADSLEYGTKINELDPATGEQLTLEFKTIEHEHIRHSVQDPSISEAERKRARHLRGQALWHITFRKYWALKIIGFLIAIVLVYILGYFISGLLGRTTLRVSENWLLRIPGIRSLYPNIKQVTEFLIGERPFEFTGVVAVEYPRKGVWSLGLLTGPAMKTIQNSAVGLDLVTVFVPSSPTPFTGYTITIPRMETIELALSIDEALRFTISGGVIKPTREGGALDMDMQDVFPAAKFFRSGPAEDSNVEDLTDDQK